MEKEIAARTTWVSALSVLPDYELITFTTELATDWTVCAKSIPQSGLGMLKMKDSAFEEAFYLGEFPLASAWIEVTTPEGCVAEGAAQVMDDRLELAEALALCDAVLAARLPGWEGVAARVNQGLAIREKTRQQRNQILARTQVDFSLLDDVGNADARS